MEKQIPKTMFQLAPTTKMDKHRINTKPRNRKIYSKQIRSVINRSEMWIVGGCIVIDGNALLDVESVSRQQKRVEGKGG